MSLQTQAKVLRVLQEMKITRVGSTEVIPVDVRIIAATNKEIKEEIKKGTFREDLFYRLNVIPFYVPSLRERREDIPLLVNYFAKKICKTNNIKLKEFSNETISYLTNYQWPGNIRQLRNIVERLIIIVDGDKIDIDDIKKHIDYTDDFSKDDNGLTKYDELKLNAAVDEFEKDFIIKKLKENNYNISKTANSLGVYPSNLYSKVNKLGITIESKK